MRRFFRGAPEAHAVQRSQKIVQDVVSLWGSDHQRKTPLDDERGKLFVKALVALGVGKEQTAQCVQTPLERG